MCIAAAIRADDNNKTHVISKPAREIILKLEGVTSYNPKYIDNQAKLSDHLIKVLWPK